MEIECQRQQHGYCRNRANTGKRADERAECHAHEAHEQDLRIEQLLEAENQAVYGCQKNATARMGSPRRSINRTKPRAGRLTSIGIMSR